MAAQLLKFILLEETSGQAVQEALERLRQVFVDFNELRVSFSKEIAEALPGVPHALRKAARLTRLFNAMFLRHNTMNWDFVRTMGVRELRQYFERIEGGDAVLGAAAVLFFSEGHAVPADADVRRILSRLGLIAGGESVAELQAFLERAVSREQSHETWALLHWLGERACLVGEPRCGQCSLKAFCPTGKELLAAQKERAARSAAKARTRTARPAGKKRPKRR